MKKTDRQWLVWALAAYAVLSLGSMFTMGIGAALVGVALLFALGGPAGLLAAIQSMSKVAAYRSYATAAFALLAALAISLLVAEISPLRHAGRFSQVQMLKDLSKSWYLLWPLLLGAALASVGADGRRTVLRAWLVAFA
ncbi:MAG TPA: hypothetical protein VM598_13640, partial [Bdellovibrionota bacterium]|nr:hypothetical protein [Bdellovibrionota bacterium]